MDLTTRQELEDQARQIRCHIIKMLEASGSGHPGGSLSETDILTYLYFYKMKIDPQQPKLDDRDRFVLSKGHGAPGLYATLATRGFFSVDDLTSLRKLHSPLQGHPDMRKLVGIEMSTGSLGQGFSAACGMAMAGKMDQSPWRVYVLLGDGEMQEGQVWEAAMAAAHYRLHNLTAILDYNGLQIDGTNECVMCLGDVGAKWKAFGWNVLPCDGHSMEELDKAFSQAVAYGAGPSIIIAKTVKGKGVSFMENAVDWHGKAPDKAQAAQALADLGCQEVVA